MDISSLIDIFCFSNCIEGGITESSAPLWLLFFSAFISSTVAPGGSEVLVAALASQAHYSPGTIISIATLGNTLGAITTYGLGRWLSHNYSPEKLTKYQSAINQVKKYGVISLLGSWLPVIGDGLCFAAGWLKIPLLYATALIMLGKAARYSAIVYLFN